MRLSFKVLTLALFGILAGCATTTPSEPTEERLGLTPRTLSAGECGLFVWKADETKTFILFSNNNGTIFYQDGAEMSLTPVGTANAPRDISFMDPKGQTVVLSLRKEEDFQGSRRYKLGRLTSQDKNGWDVVSSVVGLYSCQN